MTTTTFIKRVALDTLKLVESEVALPWVDHLHILIVNDRTIRTLNALHRNKDKATDVLSFPSFEPKEIQGRRKVHETFHSSLGDLVISIDTTLRQAEEYRVSVREEVIRLIVHGILHLCGYDHEGVSKKEAERMRRKERRLRKVVGLPLGETFNRSVKVQ